MTDGSYRNPVLRADWSDPDVIRVHETYYLVASSFNRVPGLPVLASPDLVNWTIGGHALDRLEPADRYAVPRPGCGVWAPAIRWHDGRFWIFYPDPDRGIFVVTATDPAGRWSRPHLLKAGAGLIDPCPLWDEDGSAYLVHAWARSRAGFNNRITCHRMRPDGTGLLDEGRTIIDGDRLPGYRTLEGPKAYRWGGWYWIFAPAGGVATGWQSAFRARHIFGPYEDRIVLAQGDTDINGPHQGAWVDTPGGQHWFLHFQDRGAYGRVVHLQPMSWADDGWPRIGRQDGTGSGTGAPVAVHRRPALPAADVPCAPATSDEWTWQAAAGGHAAGVKLGRQWSWPANPDPSWWSPLRPAGLRLACVRSADPTDLRKLPNVLGQRLPADPCQAVTTVTLSRGEPGSRAGLTVLGAGYAWIGLEQTDEGVFLVHRRAEAGRPEADAADRVRLPAGRSTVTVRVDVAAEGRCQFWAGIGTGQIRPIGPAYQATPGHWIGATLGLFASAPPGTGPAGHADFTALHLTTAEPMGVRR
nr:glycoside hydrolase 43 family protein [Micromonospora sp. DSM 115978]